MQEQRRGPGLGTIAAGSCLGIIMAPIAVVAVLLVVLMALSSMGESSKRAYEKANGGPSQTSDRAPE